MIYLVTLTLIGALLAAIGEIMEANGLNEEKDDLI
jgi:hypothetical protein